MRVLGGIFLEVHIKEMKKIMTNDKLGVIIYSIKFVNCESGKYI